MYIICIYIYIYHIYIYKQITITLIAEGRFHLIAEGRFHIMFKNIFLYLIIKENLPLVGGLCSPSTPNMHMNVNGYIASHAAWPDPGSCRYSSNYIQLHGC